MKRIIPHILFLLILISCQKQLDVKPRGVLLPETVDDFENVLNSQTLTLNFPTTLLYPTDDIYTNYSALHTSAEANAYFWKPQLDANGDQSPAVWGTAYRSIYNTNVIIKNIMQATGGTEEKKRQVYAEALVMRADSYFVLLTAFCKPYNVQTASSDPGLPLVTGTDVTDNTPPRSSVKAAWDMIIKDLLEAIDMLPNHAINKSRITKYVAAGLLARIYLYASDFEKAKYYAEIALEGDHALRDLNNYATPQSLPEIDFDPEILWLKLGENVQEPYNVLFSEDLIDKFEENDLRFTLLTKNTIDGISPSGPDGWANFGITFPEMYLVLAETLARANEVAEAMAVINELRSKRIQTSVYTPLSASEKEEAINMILAERRRELAFKGQRFADMKRLSTEGRIADLKRINRGTGTVIATLDPSMNNLLFEIPLRVQRFNPLMEKNF